MDQRRLLIALILSAAILFGWEYFLRRTIAPPQNEVVNSPPAATTSSATPSPQATEQTTPQSPPPANPASVQDVVPQRTLTIATPLYVVKLDSRGAVATSWIIKENKDTGRPLYSIAGDRNNPQPLELIPSENIRQKQLLAPLGLSIGDDTLDTALATKNYGITGIEDQSDNARLELKPGEQKRIEFVMRDPSTGIDVTKSFTFNADQYDIDFSVNLTRAEQPVQNVKVAIGPSLGDQGVPQYTFYSVAPEGIYAVPGAGAERPLATDIHVNEGSPDRKIVNGVIDWAAVGDTYFAMVAVPPKPVEGLEYRTTKYEHEHAGTKEARYLITGLLSVPAEGSPTRLYIGPKDHYLLSSVSDQISRAVGRTLDLEGLIDYGWFSTISRPIAVPILWSIKRLNALTGSYGIAIVLFTIIIYSLFFPLKWRSSKAMKKAQKMAPRMKEVQEKIKGLKQNDPRLKELQMEQLRLMKEGNPLGGCLPILIQMPFLFALYRAITISIDFRQATFLWMPDLSAADPLHLLPFLMAGSMVVLQLITPAPSADPLQRKMMAVVLPMMMLYMLWSAPAGLLVYWFVGNIVGFSQQMLINRMIKSEDDEEPPEKKKAETRPPKKFGPARASQA